MSLFAARAGKGAENFAIDDSTRNHSLLPTIRLAPTGGYFAVAGWLAFAAVCWGAALAQASQKKVGLFISAEARERLIADLDQLSGPPADSYRNLMSRANSGLSKQADPFWMSDVTEIKFGWCGKPAGEDDTLKELTEKLDKQSDTIRSLALGYSLSGKAEYAKKAEEMLLDWAKNSTLLNLYDLDIDFRNARMAGSTDTGYCGDRPWNMALDTMWQAYGLINMSDAYLLLQGGGHAFSSEKKERIEHWIRELAEAVNSSFHAWTRWADLHQSSSAFTRYRSDNHLGWCLAGLLSAAVALDDEELANYVLHGGEWNDSKAGSYANPSSIRALIDLAIESGTGAGSEGRIYEEKIRRKPPVGYAFFHLWAMTLVAQIAETHYDEDLWNYQGSDGASLESAFLRYADYILEKRDSPKPEQESSRTAHSWLYEIASTKWDDPALKQARDRGKRSKHMRQSIGPVTLIFGRD